MQKKIVIALVLAAAVILAWIAYGAYDKRAQAREIATLVDQGAAQLAQAQEKTPSPQDVAAAQRTSQALGATTTSRQKEMARIAGEYLAATAVLVQRYAELARLKQRAADSKQALAAHMGAAARRDASWIHGATELKRKADQDQGELERLVGAIADVQRSLEETRMLLAPHLASARR